MKRYYSKSDLEGIYIEKYAKAIRVFLPRIDVYNIICDPNIEYPGQSAKHFIQGSCQVFAFVLGWVYPEYKVFGVENQGGCHYFCKYKEFYIDVRGLTENFKLFTRDIHFDFSEEECKPYVFESEDFGDYYDLEIAFALSIIVCDMHRYSINADERVVENRVRIFKDMIQYINVHFNKQDI